MELRAEGFAAGRRGAGRCSRRCGRWPRTRGWRWRFEPPEAGGSWPPTRPGSSRCVQPAVQRHQVHAAERDGDDPLSVGRTAPRATQPPAVPEADGGGGPGGGDGHGRRHRAGGAGGASGTSSAGRRGRRGAGLGLGLCRAAWSGGWAATSGCAASGEGEHVRLRAAAQAAARTAAGGRRPPAASRGVEWRGEARATVAVMTKRSCLCYPALLVGVGLLGPAGCSGAPGFHPADAAPTFAADALADYVPPDAGAVYTINQRQALDTPAGRRLAAPLRRFLEGEKTVRPWLDGLGIDPIEDVEESQFLFCPPDLDQPLVLLRGRFDATRLRTARGSCGRRRTGRSGFTRRPARAPATRRTSPRSATRWPFRCRAEGCWPP